MDYRAYILETDPVINIDPQETLQILTKLNSKTLHFSQSPEKPNENSDSTFPDQEEMDDLENSSEEEYVFVILDPDTGEEREIASGDLPPGMEGRQLYYDPIKKTLLASPDVAGSSIIDQLNYEGNISPTGDIPYKEMTYCGNSKKTLTGDEELVRILGKLSRQIGRYNAKAHIYRILNYIVNIGSIVVTSTIGFLLATEQGTSTILSIMAFSIAIIKGVHELLKLGSLGIIYKGLAIRLQSMFREVQEARDIMVTDAEKLQYASLVLSKMSEIDLETFKASYGPKVLKDSDSEDAPMVSGGVEVNDGDDDQPVNIELDPELEVTPVYNNQNDIRLETDNIGQPNMDDVANTISGDQLVKDYSEGSDTERSDIENQMI